MVRGSWKSVLVVLGFLMLEEMTMLTSASPPEKPHEPQCKEILVTSTTIYSFCERDSSAAAAERVCQQQNGHLVALNNPSDYSLLLDKLKDVDADLIWTSGVSFSNASVEDLLLWKETMEPISNPDFEELSQEGASSKDAISVRNRREVVSVSIGEEDGDCCSCEPTTPEPFTRPPCRTPVCHINVPSPLCREVKPRNCTLTSAPECTVKQNNCTVDCSEPCRVVQQPRCRIKPDSKPRCQLKQPGPCGQVGTPNCTIISPGACTAIQDQCEQEKGTCQPIIKPCKNPCTQPECTTTQMPCTTTQRPCETTTPSSCPVKPSNPSCTLEQKCRRKRQSDNKGNFTLQCEVIETCPDNIRPKPVVTPVECRPETICPPAEVSCPPPVTSCTRPFVDCSPEVCQSSVQICLPPKIHCPPARIVCESPTVKCETPKQGECPLPEVVCEKPEIECSKPRVECPDALVHCDPTITTCGQAPTSCSEPEMVCTTPEVNCQEPVTCPPPGEVSQPGSNCPCKGKKCKGNKGGRSKDPLLMRTDVEFVEKTMCIALKKNDAGFKWIRKSCNLKTPFLCSTKPAPKSKDGIGLSGLLDLTF